MTSKITRKEHAIANECYSVLIKETDGETAVKRIIELLDGKREVVKGYPANASRIGGIKESGD